MADLQIEVAENGFIVTTKFTTTDFSNENGETVSVTNKKWCFDTAKPLADFVKEWADNSKKPILKADCTET